MQPEERKLFRALSVFPGPFAMESAVLLTEGAGMSRLETIDLVSALVDQTLLIRLSEPGPGRYDMLGAIREYGQAQLVANEEDEAVRASLRGDRHFADRAATARLAGRYRLARAGRAVDG